MDRTMDWQGHPQFSMPAGHESDFDQGDGGAYPNKNKNNKDGKKNVVEIQYEGYYLEKAEPLPGHKLSWARVGKRSIPVSSAKLMEMSRKSKAETGYGPAFSLAQLSSNQQGVIGRLIESKQLNEQSKSAQWVLDCTRRYTEKKWGRPKITKTILVILKRQDKNAPAGSNGKASGGATHYDEAEIIDLDEPAKKKAGKKNKNGQNQNHDDGVVEGPINGIPDPFASLGANDGVIDVPPPQHFPPQHGGHDQFPPPGAIPVNGLWPQQQPQQHQPQPYHGHNAPRGNPFQPNAHLNTPNLYQNNNHNTYPPTIGRDPHFSARTHDHHPDDRDHRNSRSRSRSASRLRRAIENERYQSRVNQQRLEQKVDELTGNLVDVLDRVDNLNLRETSSEESARRDRLERGDLWDRDDDRYYDSPPSSPSYTEVFPSGTLGRRHSTATYRRDSGRRLAIEPARRPSHRRHNSSNDYRPAAPEAPLYRGGGGNRPRVHNDYPNAPVAEARMLPQYESPEYGRAEFGGRGRDRGYHENRQGRRSSQYRGGAVYPDDQPRGGRRDDRVWS